MVGGIFSSNFDMEKLLAVRDVGTVEVNDDPCLIAWVVRIGHCLLKTEDEDTLLNAHFKR